MVRSINSVSPKEWTRLIEEYEKGAGTSFLGKKFDLNHKSLLRRLHVMGVEIHPQCKKVKIAHRGRTKKVVE